MRVSINPDVQLPPAAAQPDAVFLIQPFALAVDPWRYFPEGASVEKDLQENWPTNAAGYAALPNVVFVIPNQNDDWHDGTVLQGDSWLQQNIVGYAQWRVGARMGERLSGLRA